jgi:hypothetical protein
MAPENLLKKASPVDFKSTGKSTVVDRRTSQGGLVPGRFAVSTGSVDEERSWAAEKRDFVAEWRDGVAVERDSAAEAVGGLVRNHGSHRNSLK